MRAGLREVDIPASGWPVYVLARAGAVPGEFEDGRGEAMQDVAPALVR